MTCDHYSNWNKSHSITQLKSNSSITSSPTDIADLFANHFASISSNDNHNSHSLPLKTNAETQQINFVPLSNTHTPCQSLFRNFS